MNAQLLTPNALKPGDIEVFAEAIRHYFQQITGERAQVRTAYMQELHTPPIQDDFNGLIQVKGDYQGCVCFSAPQSLLSHVLLRQGESRFSEADHLDIVGEIANNLAGRARRVFGEGLEISPPLMYTQATPPLPSRARSRPYVIPFCWKAYEATLVVHLDCSDSMRA